MTNAAITRERERARRRFRIAAEEHSRGFERPVGVLRTRLNTIGRLPRPEGRGGAL